MKKIERWHDRFEWRRRGDVEQYPTVDTELDYWMDKCVELYVK